MARSKRAKHPNVSPREKLGKGNAPSDSIVGMRPLFCFAYTDRAWLHSALDESSDGEVADLLIFIHEMAQLTWGAIFSQTTGYQSRHKKHHYQEVSTITNADAKKYLQQQRLSEQFGGELFRFRLGRLKRLWGFEKKGVFHVIWWDPGHLIYDTDA